MRYQSLWWKCAAALLALCLLIKLLLDFGFSGPLEKIANSRLLVGLAAPERVKFKEEEAWLAGESAEPPAEEAAQPLSLPEEEEDSEKALPGIIINLEGPLPSINNYTSYQLDWAALFRERWSSRLPRELPQILIIHTHSCEAYTQEGENTYEESDPYRTLDKAQSVVRVGDELARVFTENGFGVIHDREYYDYPGYSGSYGRSLEAVETWLTKYPSIRVVIDVHRDALDGGKKTVYSGGGVEAAQVMLLITTGEAGLYHPNWKENLKLALEIQTEMERRYDGFARPLCLSRERYNEHASPGYLLLEVGTNLNSLEEALKAAELFAGCASKVLAAYME